MIIVLLGASGSGKSTIENELATHHGFEKIISYTTRRPRAGEANGREYYFINNETFMEMLKDDLFAEYDEYSQGRMYGTLVSDYTEGDKVVVLTPNGLRKLKKNYRGENVYSVFVEADLGSRMKRYIDRCGVHKFNFDDKNEIASRVDRDFGMFLGLENEVDMVVHNDEKTDIKSLVNEIIQQVRRK